MTAAGGRQPLGVTLARAGTHIWIEKPVGLSTVYVGPVQGVYAAFQPGSAIARVKVAAT